MAVARRNPLLIVGKYAAILFYLSFALFPLYWLLKISITPDQLIYTEGTALWPTDATLENFGKVIWQTDFLRFFWNSLIVSLSSAAITTVIAAGAGYAFSRFRCRGQMIAAGVLALIHSCLFFIFIQRYLVRDLTSGTVKG